MPPPIKEPVYECPNCGRHVRKQDLRPLGGGIDMERCPDCSTLFCIMEWKEIDG